MRKLIVAVTMAVTIWPAPSGAVECAPGRSRGNLQPSLRDYPDVPPFRVYGRAQANDPFPVFVGVKSLEDDPASYGEVLLSTEGAMVHGRDRGTDTGFQAGANTTTGGYVCVHAAGQHVEVRR